MLAPSLILPPLDTVTLTPGSDEWMLVNLAQALNTRLRGDTVLAQGRRTGRPGLQLLWDYQRGEPPLPKCADGWADAMWEFMRMSRTHYAGMAVRSLGERLWPRGWTTAVDNDLNGDQLAAEIAGRNQFDLSIGDVIEDMLWSGETYMMVAPPLEGERIPVVTAEDPLKCIVHRDRATGRVDAGLKVDVDEWTGQLEYRLFRPGSVRRAGTRDGQFDWLGGPLETVEGRVSLVPFTNKSRIGEFERHLDILNRINDGLMMRVTVAKFQAFRQRAAKLPDKDENGDVIDYSDVFTADPGAMWQVPLDAEFWESQQVDLTPIRMSIRDDVEAFAQAVGVPVNWLSSDAANQTAAGSNNAQAGNQFRAEDRQRRANAGFAEVMAQSFAYLGDQERAQAWRIKTLWAPVERYSITDKGSAGTQWKSAGMPFEQTAIEVFQVDPADLPALSAQRSAELLFQEPTSAV